MKIKFWTFIFGLFFGTGIQAQSYYINFTATGESTTIDSVKVANLTQCTTINISGDDVLNLVATLGVNDINFNREKALSIYPNPFEQYCNIEFEAPARGLATFYVYDMNGKIISQMQKDLKQGNHKFILSGINMGVYVVRIISEHYTYTGKIISHSDVSGIPNIICQEPDIANQNNKINSVLKNTTSTIQMQYNTGDHLKFTGKSGIYRTVIMFVPTSSETVNFNFISCSDTNGNNYAVVKIGDQWWMAENLNAGTYVPIASPQVFGTKFCMDINGQADPDCPMGGLYEWENLMQGGLPCNGTDAPPNDRCTSPVKGLCPNGWHIPSHYEWTTLARNAGSSPGSFVYDMNIGVLGVDEGGNLKETCTTYWWDPNAGATNFTGFSAIPGGDTWAGVFEDFGQSAYFWTTTLSYSYMPWVYALNYSIPLVGRSLYVRENGFSCRCVKD